MYPRFEKPDRKEQIREISALFYEALEKIGPAGYFRVRVLLEMAVIQLEVDAQALEPDKPVEPEAE